MMAKKLVILTAAALAGGIFLAFRLKISLRRTSQKKADDILIDSMSEQSFPASDAPAY
jgi:hypothetical protein